MSFYYDYFFSVDFPLFFEILKIYRRLMSKRWKMKFQECFSEDARAISQAYLSKADFETCDETR